MYGGGKGEMEGIYKNLAFWNKIDQKCMGSLVGWGARLQTFFEVDI